MMTKKSNLIEYVVCHSEAKPKNLYSCLMERFFTSLRSVQNDNIRRRQRGSALLVVLGVVMVITILSLAFISRSNIDLACGENMILKVKMDYLAESGLEHARGLIINPQEIEDEYWKDGPKQYFSTDGFYYDVEVNPNESLPEKIRWRSYDINSEAYKLSGGSDKIAKSSLKAILTLYPAVAFWSDSSSQTLGSGVTINGDAYFAGSLTCDGTIDGYVFCNNILDGEVRQKDCSELLSLLQWPDIKVSDFSTFENITLPLGESYSSPPEVFKYAGDLAIEDGDIVINGMLIVDGNLAVEGTNLLKLIAQKNLPALLVTGNLEISADASLDIEGLVIVQGQVEAETGSSLEVLGGLFTRGGIQNGQGNITITAAPAKTAIYIYVMSSGEWKKWSQAPTAFFQDIRRDRD
ncbi:MAG: hypothetical protein WDA68_01905 [Phycisphaerae bacterium]